MRKSQPLGEGTSVGVVSDVSASSVNSVHGAPPVHPESTSDVGFPKASTANDFEVVAVPDEALCVIGTATADDAAASGVASSRTASAFDVVSDAVKFCSS